MNKEKTDYKNWVPKNFVIIPLIIAIILLIFSLIPFNFIVQIILLIFFSVLLGIGLFAGILYYFFGKNGNEFQHQMYDVVIKQLSWNGQGKALDIGAGSGAMVIKLAKKYPTSEVIGIDYWGKGWDYSKELCEKNAKIEGVQERCTFQKASAINLPIKDGEFDAVVSNFVFHEVRGVKDRRELIKEALRILKKNGNFSFQDVWGLNERVIDDLLNWIKELGINEVNFVYTKNLYTKIPLVLRLPFYNPGILYGKK